MNKSASDGSPRPSVPSPGAGLRPTNTLSIFSRKTREESGEFAPSCTWCGSDCRTYCCHTRPMPVSSSLYVRIFCLCSRVSCLVWVDSSLSWYSQLELKPCEHRSLGMDEFVVLVAETCVTSYFVLSNLLMSVCQMNRQRRLWSYVLRAEREKLSLCVGRLLKA